MHNTIYSLFLGNTIHSSFVFCFFEPPLLNVSPSQGLLTKRLYKISQRIQIFKYQKNSQILGARFAFAY